MSSAKRPYNETISSNSSNPINDNNDNNDYIVNVVEEQHEVEEDMEIEHYLKVEQMSKQSDSFKNQQEAEEESFISSRRKRLNTDKDTFISNPFPSTLNNHSFQSLSSTSSTLNYSSLRNTISSTPYPPSGNTSFYKVPTTTNVTYHPLSESNYISPRDSFNPSNSTLKVSEIEQDTKALSPIDLLMSSPPISTSTQKTNRTRNTSNSSLTLTTNNLDTWNNIEDFNYTSPRNSASKLRARTNANTTTSNDSSAEALNSTISSYFNVANPYSSLNSNNDNPSSNSENIINNDSSSNENYSNNDNINNVSSINGNNDNPSSNNDNINNSSSNNGNTNNPTSNNDYFSSIYAVAPNNQLIRTQLTKNGSKGPFKPIYSQLYDNKRIVVDTESFNYLIQLYEFCDNSSTKLQSNVTSILRDLVLLLNNQIDGFDIPFIEHHKWNGSSFYGPIDVITLLDQLDDGLGLSLAEFVFYDRNYKYDDYMRASGFVLQCGCRKTYRKNNDQGSFLTSTSKISDRSNDTNDLQNNELRHAVLDKDAEREAQLFLELLAQEEDDGVEDNGTEQGENSTEQDSSSEQDESDSFTEISKESEDDDDDYSLNEDFASASIQQPTDTFGNPINSIRTTSIVARHISRPSGNDDGNETDDDSGNLSESTFEEVDFSDIESIATDSTIEDGWHSVSRDNN